MRDANNMAFRLRIWLTIFSRQVLRRYTVITNYLNHAKVRISGNFCKNLFNTHYNFYSNYFFSSLVKRSKVLYEYAIMASGCSFLSYLKNDGWNYCFSTYGNHQITTSESQ